MTEARTKLNLPAHRPSRQVTSPDVTVERVDFAAWYERHEHFLNSLQHMSTRAVRNSQVEFSAVDAKHIADAFDALRAHAKVLARDNIPIVLTRDGKHTIPFDQLTKVRAEVHALRFELNEARAAVSLQADPIPATRSGTGAGNALAALQSPAATILSWSPSLHNRGLTRSYKTEWHRHDMGPGTKLFTEQQLRTVVAQALGASSGNTESNNG